MRRRRISTALLLALLGLPFAANAQMVIGGTAAIVGRVTNALTGEPLDGAIVHLFPLRVSAGPRANFTTTSQPDGGFHFDALAAGTYMVRGEHTGYLATSRFSPGDRIQLGTGQFLNDVQIKLTPESSMSGKVFDDAGNAVASARVRALQKTMSSGRIELQDRSLTQTDQAGAFALGKLRPGKYVIVVDPPPPDPEQTEKPADPNGELVTTMYPHALNVDGAEEVEVSAGYSPAGLKVYLKRTAAYHIRGRLGQGVGTVRQLMLSPQETGTSMALARRVTLAKDGRFEVSGVVNGDYALRAIAGRRTQLLAKADVAVSGADVNDVVVAALPPVTVAGSIRVPDESNVANISGYVHIIARPLNDEYASASVAQVASDGTFRFGELAPEEWVFSAVPGASGVYVKTIVSNGQDVRGKPIDLSQFPSVTLDVALQNGAATIGGTVQLTANEDPSGISVVLVPKQVDALGSNVQFRSTQRGGMFSFVNLAPDEYTLFAVQRVDVDVWQNSAFLQQIASEGTPVDVSENQQQQVQLKILPYEQIAQAAVSAGLPEE